MSRAWLASVTTGLISRQSCAGVSYVIVECVPYGIAQFPEAVCDIYVTDELTVSCTDTAWDEAHGPIRTFKPGSWKTATCYDRRGNILYAFLGRQQQQQSDDQFRAALASARERLHA